MRLLNNKSKEFNMPIILISALNRTSMITDYKNRAKKADTRQRNDDNEAREKATDPHLGKGSSNIEYDSNNIINIINKPKSRTEKYIGCAKCRTGKSGDVVILPFHGAYYQFGQIIN